PFETLIGPAWKRGTRGGNHRRDAEGGREGRTGHRRIGWGRGATKGINHRVGDPIPVGRWVGEESGGEGGWSPPGMTPVRYLDQLGLLRPRTIVVHAVCVDDDDVLLLSERGVSVCLCPRSNLRTGVGPPPVRKLVAAGVHTALGTDSLASNGDLDLRKEMAALSGVAPDLPSSAILRMATLGGARALGFDHRIGSLEPGKEARLIAITAKAGTIPNPEAFIVTPDERQDVTHL
ncbi:MAG: amidohydrolase family protein, partial [Candidatus Latescibacteria bacterium]|nr:amidohydrolase family protein [Candidatus Latescibacterota bacterium]